jgi:alkanesulfonate monooxygenase SsuD/methylene tetrahydromethanopterin reductase-like flavin-dependent oxidoreductase (luciferase family)
MSHELRFQVLILPNVSWNELLRRFLHVEELGFDFAGVSDQFTDWKNSASPWFEMWTALAGIAAATSRIGICPIVAQLPLRNPAMFAREALTIDHISNGRLEIGIGLGLTVDLSYDIMGIPNWTNPERMARFPEYIEIVDRLLRNEETTFKGKYYEVNNAIMNPRPIKKPRPPITIAAMGPKMLKVTAQFADTWNSMSFEEEFEDQLADTKSRVSQMAQNCKAIGRDPETLRHSYHMYDVKSRATGGFINYYESEDVFINMVKKYTALGMSEFNLYYPMQEEQLPMFEHIAKNVFPQLRAEFLSEN